MRLFFEESAVSRSMRESPGGRMDFIERIFGVSPDGGNGSLEGLYVTAAVAAVFAAAFAWRRRGHMRARLRGLTRDRR